MQVHMSHSPYYYSQTLQFCTCEVKLSYSQTDTLVIYTMHLSLQVECWAAHIHTDCSNRTGEGQATEEEDTPLGGYSVPTGISRLGPSTSR